MHQTSALSMADLHSVAADIKNSLSATIADAISEMCSDIQAISLGVEETEEMQARHVASLCQMQEITESHAVHLRELNRHMEDLDNCGRCRNLQVRGLPESIDSNQLSGVITTLFNDLLERPPDMQIVMEHMHRTLRPRGRDTDPPGM